MLRNYTSALTAIITAATLITALPAQANPRKQAVDATAGWRAYAPAGWKVIHVATGDLNKDGTADAVLVIEQMNKAFIKPNQGLGPQELNLNPRRVLLLLGGEDPAKASTPSSRTYRVAATADSFIPSENSEDTPCLSDPLENGGIAIANGVLTVTMSHWLSCGSWSTSNRSYKFRYEDERLRLIGFDMTDMMRNSGEMSEVSINYLSGKKKMVTGLNAMKDMPSKPKTRWMDVPTKRKLYMDQLNPACPDSNPQDPTCIDQFSQ